MNKIAGLLIYICLAAISSCTSMEKGRPYKGPGAGMPGSTKDTVTGDSIIYHPVRLDENGAILPWYSADPGESYHHVLDRVWLFWKNIETDSNGQKFYMNHQVWRPGHDRRGLGGDQLSMALSSWDLYYNYTGDQSVLDNMKYVADYYLTHSLSSSTDAWPDLPYPYNMNVESGIYDGDMIIGKNYLQPDKAGSFGYELVHLYKKTGDQKYLDAAIKIANTLAAKVQPGDNDNSPWPFKVNAKTGETGLLIEQEVWYEGMDKDIRQKKNVKRSSYTTFWTATLGLFDELTQMNKGNTGQYRKAFTMAADWMKKYPGKTNKWGPFFEDVPRWSDTQINGITYAMYLMDNPGIDPDWKQTVSNIFKWVYDSLANRSYEKYGVTVIDEQTAYRQPGNSHSARQASMELRYWELTGDTARARNAIRMLNWATYMVDHDGKNFYPTNDIWMTDGYGDYTRHYLRAMAAFPALAPASGDHLLRTSSIVSNIVYEASSIRYSRFDSTSKELFRLRSKPEEIKAGNTVLSETDNEQHEGWTWQSLDKGGILKINQSGGKDVLIKW